MNYLHYRLNLEPNAVVEVMLDQQANVKLLDEINYMYYQRGDPRPFETKQRSAWMRDGRRPNWKMTMTTNDR